MTSLLLRTLRASINRVAAPSLMLLLLLAGPNGQGQQVAMQPDALPQLVCSQPPDTAASLDYRVLKTLQEGRFEGWNRHWVAMSNTFVLAPLAPVGIALGGRLAEEDPLLRRQRYADALESGGAYLFCMGVTMGIKALVDRPRPWVAYAGDLVCLQTVRSSSFPSGHTSSLFVTATLLTLLYPRWYVAVPAYLWAGSVAFSRLYVGAHYPTDVLAGAALGTGCAFLAHAVRQRICRQHPELYPPQAITVPLTFSF